jgi:hypothetical protein
VVRPERASAGVDDRGVLRVRLGEAAVADHEVRHALSCVEDVRLAGAQPDQGFDQRALLFFGSRPQPGGRQRVDQ